MKIVVLDGHTLNPGNLSWQKIEQYGELSVYPSTHKENILERIINADIVFTNKTPLDQQTIEACPKLRYIGVLATGFNIVDISAAAELGITVCNVPGYSTGAVAQYTFALLLHVFSHVSLHHESVKRGEWAESPDFCYWKQPLAELEGKTMGIIGFGRIGQAVAKIALAFGMKVLVHTPRPKEGFGLNLSNFVPLDELLRNSDVVSLHCPLSKETKHLISHDTLALMKRSAVLINTSRGGLINEQDLARALETGGIAGAAVDVVSEEPIREDNPLLNIENCIITPHVAWASLEARQRLMETTAENLAAYLRGQPQHTV